MFLEHNTKSFRTKSFGLPEKKQGCRIFGNLAYIFFDEKLSPPLLLKHTASSHIAALVVWFG